MALTEAGCVCDGVEDVVLLVRGMEEVRHGAGGVDRDISGVMRHDPQRDCRRLHVRPARWGMNGKLINKKQHKDSFKGRIQIKVLTTLPYIFQDLQG